MSQPIILIRHAQSTWNAEHRFSGWADPDLTEQGKREARDAGRQLQLAGFRFDTVYSSVLVRAKTTADLLLQYCAAPAVHRFEDWRLNERHYGALQGLNKDTIAAQVGEAQVWRWRRGYEDTPPAMPDDDPRHPRFDPRYAGVPRARLPGTENLRDTRTRVMEFWQQRIRPDFLAGKRILVSAHGNTLRGLLMGLTDMSVAAVEAFEIPTGMPIVCEVDAAGSIKHWQYLMDPVTTV